MSKVVICAICTNAIYKCEAEKFENGDFLCEHCYLIFSKPTFSEASLALLEPEDSDQEDKPPSPSPS